MQQVIFEHRDLDEDSPFGAHEEIDGLAIRQLRTWVDQMLRIENCTAAHRLLNVLNNAVWAQAFDKGVDDARQFQESKLSPHAQPLWRDGYENGFSHEMSQIAERS